jgi:hypothetical protein
MIPTIEQIIEDLLGGSITKQQAIGWLHQHAYRDLRDDFAAAALQGLLADPDNFDPAKPIVQEAMAELAYEYANAMLAAREKP